MVSTIVQVARGQLLHVLVAASVEHMDRFGAFEVWIPREPGNWRKEWLILMSWVGLGHVWRFGVVIGLAEETTDSMVLRFENHCNKLQKCGRQRCFIPALNVAYTNAIYIILYSESRNQNSKVMLYVRKGTLN